jgi:large subunit ribosomal protein L2
MLLLNLTFSEYKNIKRKKYLKNLLVILKKRSGRSNKGNIILYGYGGGYKKYYRIIDFKKFIINIPAKIFAFEYDPLRNIYLILLLYINSIFTYSLAPLLVKINLFLINKNLLFLKNGNCFELINCLIGSFIHCIKLNSLKFKYIRAAGTFCYIVRKFSNYNLLRMPSKEELFVFSNNDCILGRLSNVHYKLIKRTNAGYNRNLGLKSKVRGVAKNPVDHPHGGGSNFSLSPFNVYTKGKRTSTRFIRFTLNKWGFFKRRSNIVW